MCEKKCRNCVWIAELKHNFKASTGWEKSHCCTIFPGIIIEVSPESVCEEFFERIDANELIRKYK